MSRAVWDRALEALRALHAGDPRLSAFVPFPDDLTETEVAPRRIPSCDLLLAEGWEASPLCAAFADAAPHAFWRLTYEDTAIGRDFLDRFGCFCLIGEGGAYASAKARAWMVYMPARLDYPWHHHPAEEIYLTLAGEAEYRREGEPPETLRAGGLSHHAPMQPHAMRTYESPVMALVMWRDRFDGPPVWTRP